MQDDCSTLAVSATPGRGTGRRGDLRCSAAWGTGVDEIPECWHWNPLQNRLGTELIRGRSAGYCECGHPGVSGITRIRLMCGHHPVTCTTVCAGGFGIARAHGVSHAGYWEGGRIPFLVEAPPPASTVHGRPLTAQNRSTGTDTSPTSPSPSPSSSDALVDPDELDGNTTLAVASNVNATANVDGTQTQTTFYGTAATRPAGSTDAEASANADSDADAKSNSNADVWSVMSNTVDSFKSAAMQAMFSGPPLESQPHQRTSANGQAQGQGQSQGYERWTSQSHPTHGQHARLSEARAPPPRFDVPLPSAILLSASASDAAVASKYTAALAKAGVPRAAREGRAQHLPDDLLPASCPRWARRGDCKMTSDPVTGAWVQEHCATSCAAAALLEVSCGTATLRSTSLQSLNWQS